ncbi:MAG: glutathione S-transferase N-terminal domain-containing protein [Xanthobacteraceae bacterium]
MIDLYYWPTSNGHKITIYVEEAGIPYQIKPVNISKGDQFKPEFLAFSPNNRMPAIIDNAPADGGKPISVFESGAILVYLAEKTGKFMPKDVRGKTEVQEWLFWQMGGLGPMSGQRGHFINHAPKDGNDYALKRYSNETNRLHGVLDKRLAGREYICGEISIADMACYPWCVSAGRYGTTYDEFPALKAWMARMAARPAVKKAYEIGKQYEGQRASDEEARKIMYGQTAASVAKAAGG